MSNEILKSKFRESLSKEDYIKKLMNSIEEALFELYSEESISYSDSITIQKHINGILSRNTIGEILLLDKDNLLKIKNLFNVDINNIFFQNTLNYINFLFSFFYIPPILNCYTLNEDQLNNCITSYRNDIFNSFGINDKINNSGYYFLKVENFIISFLDEKYLIDIIDDESLEKLFSLYRSSKTTENREIYMTNISKKIRGYFNHKKNKKQTDILDKEITKENREQISGYLHGYFSHDPKDSNGKEAQE